MKFNRLFLVMLLAFSCGGEVENMIQDETDVVKFYALVDFFEVILTDLNLKDKASRFTPGNIAKGFSDFERTVTGQ